MISLKKRFLYSDFYRVFNFKNESSTGRCILLINTFFASIANVFITGVLYTGFLTANGIDIVSVGIIAFIPYMAWGISIFSPIIFSKIKRRRALMLFNHLFYYFCVVVATTIMPMLVLDHSKRTFWFAFFLLLGNLSNALFGSGATAWHMKFLPDGDDRNIYYSYINLISAIVGTLVAVGSAAVIDLLPTLQQQGQLIFVLRFVAAVLFIVSGLMLYLIPREMPYIESSQKVKVLHIITTPLRSKKFMLTALIMMIWSFSANVNTDTWNYFVLNTVGIKYTFTYIGSAVTALGSIFMLGYWRKAIIRYSSHTILTFTIIVTGLLEVLISFTTTQTQWVFVIANILQGINAVGRNLVFANLFYINLPVSSNTDVFITFWNLTTNISILLGSMFGAWFLSLTEKYEPWEFWGLPFYGSQLLVWVKFLLFTGLSAYLILFERKIKPA